MVVKQWVCRICHYTHTSDSPPNVCPVCKAASDGFDEIDEGVTEPEIRRPLSLLMPSDNTLWRCQVCNLEHRGPRPPDVCPVCGVGPEMWDQVDSPKRLRLDTDPTMLANAMTCTVCGSHLTGMALNTCQMCGARQAWLSPPPNVAGSSEPAVGNRTSRTYVIVGSGIAALRATEAIRANDSNARVIIITREPCLPYNRLNLTRYLDGDVDAASIMLHPPDWYAKQNIEVRLETDVVSFNPREHTIRTRTRELTYDRLVIASGARVAVPPIPNVWLDGVRPLRTLRDFTSILQFSGVGRRVVILGGGVLGLEAAVTMRRRGSDVTVCERGDHVMRRQLDVAAARLLQRHLENQGIRFAFGRETEAIDGDECVRGVRFSGDDYEPADLVLLATGIRPNAALARAAGLTTNQGIVIDDTCQTSDPNIYAAGDVVEHRGLTYGTWPMAMEMGSIAGANAAGGAETFTPMTHPTVLKVVDIEVCAIGRISAEGPSDRELVHTEDAGAVYQKVVLDGGRLVGGVMLGNTQAISSIGEAMRSGIDVSSMVERSSSLKEFLAVLGGR